MRCWWNIIISVATYIHIHTSTHARVCYSVNINVGVSVQETFSRCCWCGGGLHSGRSGRLSDRRSCYSILSRSGAANGQARNGGKGRPGPQDSTDSGTSITHRHSEESMCLHPAAAAPPATVAPALQAGTPPGRHGNLWVSYPHEYQCI